MCDSSQERILSQNFARSLSSNVTCLTLCSLSTLFSTIIASKLKGVHGHVGSVISFARPVTNFLHPSFATNFLQTKQEKTGNNNFVTDFHLHRSLHCLQDKTILDAVVLENHPVFLDFVQQRELMCSSYSSSQPSPCLV
jgi:hypothetical protein